MNKKIISYILAVSVLLSIYVMSAHNTISARASELGWTLRQSPADVSWQCVAYGNGRFVAVASNGTRDQKVMVSSDGINWSLRSVGSGQLSNYYRGIAYGNGRFVAVSTAAGDSNTTTVAGGNRVMISPDNGDTWYGAKAVNNNEWWGICYGQGMFVATAWAGSSRYRVMRSPDGVTWTGSDAPAGNWRQVAYANGLFVAVGREGGANLIMTSPDAVNWTARAVPAGVNSLQGVAYGNGRWVAIGNTVSGASSSTIITSTDGINWYTSNGPANNGWQSITYGDGFFVTVALSVSGEYMSLSSKDGINWLELPAKTNNWQHVTYGNGIFAAVGSTGNGDRIMTAALTYFEENHDPPPPPTPPPTLPPTPEPTLPPPPPPTPPPTPEPTLPPTPVPTLPPTPEPTPEPPIVHTLTIRKLPETGSTGLQGAQFQISGNGIIPITVTTGADGSVTRTLQNIIAGTYTVTEIVPPQGYKLSSQVSIDFEVEGNHIPSTTLTFRNTPHTLTITKTSAETNEGLPGAVFVISGRDIEPVTVVTREDGSIRQSLADFPDGPYTVTEMTPPPGYSLSSEAKTFTLNRMDSFDYTLSFSNDPLKISVIKVAFQYGDNMLTDIEIGNREGEENEAEDIDTSNYLDGAIFSITRKCRCDEIIYDETTNDETITGNDDLNEIDEISEPREDNEEEEDEEPDDETLLCDVCIEGWERIVTAEGGIVPVDLAGLRLGIYVVQEIYPPKGYSLDSTPKEFEIFENGTVSTDNLKFVNMPHIVTITNEDANKSLLPGARYRIIRRGEDGEIEYEDEFETTSGVHELELGGLENGEYIIEQIAPPNGYKLNRRSQSFILDGADLTPKDLVFINEPIEIYIEKVSLEEGMVLIETVFNISGEISMDVPVPDGTITLSLEGFPDGEYVISEVKPPVGYLNDSVPQVFTIASGEISDVSFSFVNSIDPDFVRIGDYEVPDVIEVTYEREQSESENEIIYEIEQSDDTVRRESVPQTGGRIRSWYLPSLSLLGIAGIINTYIYTHKKKCKVKKL